MNRCLRSISLFLLMCFVIATGINSVAAVIVNSVTVAETEDLFYSPIAANGVVHLRVNVTNINNTPGNIVTVTADFVSLNVNCAGTSKIELANNDGDNIWEGNCDVSAEAGAMPANSMSSGVIFVVANETYGPSNANANLTISLYNIGIPDGVKNSAGTKLCYRFGTESSTNFNEVLNFNNINYITLIVEANGDSSCFTPGMTQGYSWDGWLPVAKLTFNDVNFNNDASQVKKLINLSNIVVFRFSSSNTYQGTRLSVDTTQLPALDTNPFVVLIYRLSFITPQNSFIVSDNAVSAEAITWTPNGFDTALNSNTYNLTFTVNKGFKGYTITDNILPSAVMSNPSNSLVTNASSINVDFTVNGTGTGVSKVFFYLNNVLIASFNSSVNTANCTPVDSSLEVYRCLFSIARADGAYNLSAVAYDFGKSLGNAVTTNVSYNVQTSPPTLKISVPKTGEKYKGTAGSMLKLSFNVSDGNGISSCWYSLDGPTSVDDEKIKNCISGINTVQLYLESGSYDLELKANDSLGMVTTVNLDFEVSDDAPPLLNYTVKISGDDALLTLLTDEFAECRYDSSDNSYDDMNDELVENTTRHTAVFDVSDRDDDNMDPEDYIYYIRCTDVSGNSNEDSLIVDLLNPQSKVNTSNIINETSDDGVKEYSESFDFGLLLAGKKVINIDNHGIPFTDILLTTESAADDVTMKVTALLNSTISYTEKVYSYISVEHSGLRDSNIDTVLIKFKVSKEWLDDAGFNKNDIILFRYDGEWIALNTTAGADSGDYVTYNAVSPGLSLFAISRIHTDVPMNVTSGNESTNLTANETIVATGAEDSEGKDGSFNWIWLLVGIVVFVIVALFILVEKNERNSPPPIFPQDRTIMGRIKRLFR